MIEQEWLTCTEPQRMLDFLRGRTSNRKCRLFAVACCRHLWNQITVNPWDRRAAEVAELFADGKASLPDLQEAAEETTSDWTAAYACAEAASTEGGVDAAIYAADNAEHAVGEQAAALVDAEDDHTAFAAGQATERQAQAALLRCIFGPLPFRPVTMSSACLFWKDGIVVRLAQAAYDDRILPAGTLDNTRLLLLAGALEEAGCMDEQILTHLRGGGEHYRGCWVIDLILGKQ